MAWAVYDNVEQVSNEHRRCVLTLGNLDGVHLGHEALINSTIEQAKVHQCSAIALTFRPNPAAFFNSKRAPKHLQTDKQKAQSLALLGLNAVVFHPFNLEFSKLEPQQFVDYLNKHLDLRAVCVGYDYRFARSRAGDVEFLREALPVPVHQVQARLSGNEPISSSRIRQAVTEGRVTDASLLLGRPYTLTGVVIKGSALGRTLGAATANLIPEQGVQPRYGVYAVRVQVDGKMYNGVANYGIRPTVGGQGPRLEAHLFHTNLNLYGKRIEVQLVGWLRPEAHFESTEALGAAIQHDIVCAKEIFHDHG